jgi:hypothetical protein
MDRLIPFSWPRQISARDVSGPRNQRSGSDNLLIYKGLIRIYKDIIQYNYFLLNQRYVAKLNRKPGIENAFYDFIVFDLWSEKKM